LIISEYTHVPTSISQQQLDHFRVTMPCGDVQRRLSILHSHIRLGARFEQHFSARFRRFARQTGGNMNRRFLICTTYTPAG
jgi:hypothetical protein